MTPRQPPADRRPAGRHRALLAGLAAAAIVSLLLSLLFGPALQAAEERAGDWVWRLGGQKTEERRVLVVDIDEKSLAEIGPWPWPRSTQARLIEQIAQLGAREQILDVVFTDPRDDDASLLAAVAEHRPVLAQVFALGASGPGTGLPQLSEQAAPRVGQPSGALDWASCPAPFSEALGHLSNFPALAALGDMPQGRTGHISPRIADDGVVRHQPAIICWQGKSYPSLAIASLMRATSETSLLLQRGGWWDAPWTLGSAGQALPALPLDERGNMRVAWRLHPDSFVSIPAADVLAGRVPTDIMTGAWVLVGASAFGMNDTIATPYSGASAGLLAHAQILSALVDGHTPYTPRAALPLQAAAAALGALLLWLLVRLAGQGGGATRDAQALTPSPMLRMPVYLLPLAALAFALALVVAHALALWLADVWVGWLLPALFVLLAGVFAGTIEHARSRSERDRLYQHLASYLPAPVAAALALQPPSSAIRASTRQVSVLLADIRNFSAYCEARPPEEAAAVLHAFFSAASRIVQAHGGVIESFQGDAVVAVWNGADDIPLPSATDEQHAQIHSRQAVAAALDLLTESLKLLPDPAPAGLEPLSLGLGLETGPAMVGSFGLASRRTHTVMGRTITIASRLVDLTMDLAHPILVGEGMAAQLGGQFSLGARAGGSGTQETQHLQSMGTFLLEGLRVPHHIYAVPLDALAAQHPPAPGDDQAVQPTAHGTA